MTEHKRETKEVREIEISVLGDGAVGKSNITLQYIKNEFFDEYNPTIMDSYMRIDTISEVIYKVKVQDTAGQEEFKSLLPEIIRGSDGFLLIYDITDEKSFKHLEQDSDRINKTKENKPYYACVVGNKCDLEELRKVDTKIAQDWAKSKGYRFIEASAKKRTNVDEAFREILLEDIKAKAPKSVKPEKQEKKRRTSKGIFTSISEGDFDDDQIPIKK